MDSVDRRAADGLLTRIGMASAALLVFALLVCIALVTDRPPVGHGEPPMDPWTRGAEWIDEHRPYLAFDEGVEIRSLTAERLQDGSVALKYEWRRADTD